MLRAWWERWPGRLEWELGELTAAGVAHQLDPAAREAGYIRLDLWPEIDGERLHLVALFPDLYPFFRFEVLAPDLELPHHQHPFQKNLCLLGRATFNWDSDDSLAGFLRTRLPQVLRAGRAEDPAAAVGLEERQGEPFGDYYPYEPRSSLLVDSAWTIGPGEAGGRLVIGAEGPPARLLRGAVLEIRAAAGRVLVGADPTLTRRYAHVLKGRWVRSPVPIGEGDPTRFLNALVALDPRLERPLWQDVEGGRLDVIGVLFPEEVGWRRNGDGWAFLVRTDATQAPRRDAGKRGAIVGQEVRYLARPGRAGRGDLAARVPELGPLADRRVALFGLGALGAPLALDLARAGLGGLRLLDHDVVEAGTTVRWPFGLGVVGYPKATVLADTIGMHYPYSEARPFVHRLGGMPDDVRADRVVLDEVLAGVDLIVDATAEWGVHHALDALARERGLPYLYAFATPGYWGGLVARIRPGKTAGCWGCLELALRDGGAIPRPPHDPAGSVQPPGCAEPTAPGAGFDVAQVALAAVRLAVGTLTAGAPGAYPDVDWDVATVALRDRAGRAIAPRWDTFALDRHPECAACAGW